MNPGQYRAALDDAADVLKESDLLRSKQLRQGNISSEFEEAARGVDYRLAYHAAIRNGDFDMLLADESLLLFSYDNSGISVRARYIYYQWPYDFPTYQDWLAEAGLNYDEVVDGLLELYQQELSDAPQRMGIGPIRYDHSIREYVSGFHPVSHLHMGHNNSMRLPISYAITPYMFVLFVIKQLYYPQWKDLARRDKDTLGYLRAARASCTPLDESIFGDDDRCELHLV
jgi:hypothetical protein